MQIFFQKGGVWGGLFMKKVSFRASKRYLYDKKAPLKPPFWKKIAFWPIGSSSRHSQLYFEPKILGMAPKFILQWVLKVTSFTFWSAEGHLFDKKTLKSPPFEKNLHFDLLDNQVDTLSFILGPKLWWWGIYTAPNRLDKLSNYQKKSLKWTFFPMWLLA